MGLGSGGGGVPDSPAGNPPRRHGASCPEHPASVLQAERCPFLTSAEGHRPGPSRAHAPHSQRPQQPHTRTPVSISKPHPNVPRGPLREEPPEPPQRDGEPRALAGQVSERALRLSPTFSATERLSLRLFSASRVFPFAPSPALPLITATWSGSVQRRAPLDRTGAELAGRGSTWQRGPDPVPPFVTRSSCASGRRARQSASRKA